MNDYKYKIDQQLLSDFYLHPDTSDSRLVERQVQELQKVITVVLIKHYNAYINNEDLRSAALLAILERRSQYDPSFSAYNYTYVIVRNEIGNKIKKYGREVFTEDYFKFDNRIYDIDPEELPAEVRRYSDYLLGLRSFSYLRIPQSDVLNLLLFLRLNNSNATKHAPDYIRDDPKAVDLMYKLLTDYIRDGK